MSGEVQHLTETSSKLLAKGQVAAARDVLLKLLAGHPEHAGTLSNLAICAAQLGDLPQALDYALRAFKRDQTNAPRIGTVGQILFQMARFEQSVAAFAIATQLAP